jgi:hypothetical protein
MITSEIKARSREFIDVRFKHENSASNGEAHRVARSFISNSAGRQVWLLQPPVGSCIPMIINQLRARLP